MARKADGEVWIPVNLDAKDAHKELQKLQGDMKKTQDEITEINKKREETEQQGVFAKNSLDKEAAKLAEMRKTLAEMRSVLKDKSYSEGIRTETAAQIPLQQNEIAEQSRQVRQLQSEYNKITKQTARYNEQLAKAGKTLEKQEIRAGELAEQINFGKRGLAAFTPAIEKANARMAKLSKRVTELIKSALLFSVITKALTEFKDWAKNVVLANDEARESFAKLKGALLTLVQPLVDVLIPAFITFANVLTRIVSVAAQIVSLLFGKTAKQSSNAAEALYEQTQAIEGVGAAASQAEKSLASFDEVNQLSGDSTGGGSSGETNLKPDFNLPELTELSEDRLQNILGAVVMIGAAIAAWKLSDNFTGGLKTFAGLAVAALGAITLIRGAWDAWVNGVSWENFGEMLGGLVAMAAGLGLAFGKIGAGIGLIVGGITMLAVGFKDAAENGWNLKNLFTSIAGLLATGLGITLLTGSWIPLLIAGIASIVLAIVVGAGKGEELIDGLKQVFKGFVDFVKGVFTGDLELAFKGIEKLFDGLKSVVNTILDSIKTLLFSFLDWLDEKTGGKFHGIIETAKGFVRGFCVFASESLGGLLDGVKTILAGVVQFVSGVFTRDWNKAWEGVKNIFRGVWNGVVSVLESAINLIIRGVNWLISQLNKISVTMPDWVPGVGGKRIGINIPSVNPISIPRLATGAVIPPNREFLAVLGDQRSGNNIEAPESLIRKIVREEAGGMNSELLEQILQAIKAGKVIQVDKRVLGKTAAEGINDLTKQTGKPVLLY